MTPQPLGALPRGGPGLGAGPKPPSGAVARPHPNRYSFGGETERVSATSTRSGDLTSLPDFPVDGHPAPPSHGSGYILWGIGFQSAEWAGSDRSAAPARVRLTIDRLHIATCTSPQCPSIGTARTLRDSILIAVKF